MQLLLDSAPLRVSLEWNGLSHGPSCSTSTTALVIQPQVVVPSLEGLQTLTVGLTLVLLVDPGLE